MKDSLKQGMTFEFNFKVPENKTVAYLYPEASEFQVMPKVFATGFLVGLFEWSCIQAVNPHIDWPNERTVGIGINLKHLAATPPGLTISVKGKLENIEGHKLTFSIIANDGVDQISKCTHERFIVNAKSFNASVESKLENALK